MTRFLDGPAEGIQLQLNRFPLFIRVCEGGGGFDALDLLDDVPQPGETLTAYMREGKPTVFHIDYVDKKTRKRTGKWLGAADYRVVKTQPPPEVMADTELWRAWCFAEHQRETPA